MTISQRLTVFHAAMLAGAATLAPSIAKADLREDAARVARLWTDEGAVVRRLVPVFLEQGRARIIDVERDGPPKTAGPCVTIAAIGPRTVDLAMATGPLNAGADEVLAAVVADDGVHPRAPGDGGTIVVTGCSGEAAAIGLAVVLQRSARSAVEVVVARSHTPLTPIAALLPERLSGPSAPRGTPGRSLGLAPIAARLERAEARARADGADEVTHASVKPPTSGRGELALVLGAGCHRIELFAEARSGGSLRFPADVDAELRLPPGVVVARDRGDASDARLDTCVGEETPAQLTYVGAPNALALHVTDGRWALPEALPVRWGPRLRAAAFSALRRRSVPLPRGEPIHESFGVQGSTTVPVPVDPGRCYLAVAGLAYGSARGMRLTTAAGVRPAIDESGQRPEGVAITFCPEPGDELVPLQVELQSGGGWWLLGVWDLTGEPARVTADARSSSAAGASP